MKLIEIENKITETKNSITKTNFNTKVTEIDNSIPDVSDIAKITNISDFVKKVDVDSKIAKYLVNEYELTTIVIDYEYRISSNKRPWRLLNFETVRCGAY